MTKNLVHGPVNVDFLKTLVFVTIAADIYIKKR